MPATEPRVDVIVPVYGGWSHVRDCLEALKRQSVPVNIIVVDDTSPDDTPDRIADEFPDVTLLRNPVNRGFAHTCNRGIAAGSSDIVLLVNSDVIAEPHLAADVIDAFDRGDDSLGSVCPLLMRPDGRIDSLGITADQTAAGFVRFHGAELVRADVDRPIVLGPYGAAAVYRRAALDQVGLLDEGIFMYGEELDLALRLRSAGWDTVALARPSGVHLGGASAGPGSSRQRYLAGFGRGYLMRAWGVLRGPLAIRAALTEVIVCARRLILHRDAKSLTGRIAGWHAARGTTRPRLPSAGLEPSIGMVRSLQMRGNRYWERI